MENLRPSNHECWV
jgi:hypothetical protein